eukprot:UN27685
MTNETTQQSKKFFSRFTQTIQTKSVYIKDNKTFENVSSKISTSKYVQSVGEKVTDFRSSMKQVQNKTSEGWGTKTSEYKERIKAFSVDDWKSSTRQFYNRFSGNRTETSSTTTFEAQASEDPTATPKQHFSSILLVEGCVGGAVPCNGYYKLKKMK